MKLRVQMQILDLNSGAQVAQLDNAGNSNLIQTLGWQGDAVDVMIDITHGGSIVITPISLPGAGVPPSFIPFPEGEDGA